MIYQVTENDETKDFLHLENIQDSKPLNLNRLEDHFFLPEYIKNKTEVK